MNLFESVNINRINFQVSIPQTTISVKKKSIFTNNLKFDNIISDIHNFNKRCESFEVLASD